MRWFKGQGWQVDYAAAGAEEIPDCDNRYTIDMSRNPLSLKSIHAIKQLKIILDQGGYNIVHCHTPIASVVTRLAAKSVRKKGLKVIYTAHGFHFYKGAPLLSWLIYYPIEKYLAKSTDCIITINDEDFNRAKNKFLNCRNIEKIDGVGVDLAKFTPFTDNEKVKTRKELGYSTADFIITNVAEINKNKNQVLLVTTLPQLIKSIPSIKVLFAGTENYSKVRAIVKRLHLESYVDFLGYRNDIDRLVGISDIAFSASLREGLPVNIIEAMASGIPIVCSKNRGHNSLIDDKKSGLLFEANNTQEMIHCIVSLYENSDFAQKLAQESLRHSKRYSLNFAVTKMANIYVKFM
ncbi:putative glycosyltransferase EpsD [Bacilli bacterium]|nr:putative glycosyltransferase EpsD [Bacilli bacterium]